jgi:hypothetical protein
MPTCWRSSSCKDIMAPKISIWADFTCYLAIPRRNNCLPPSPTNFQRPKAYR